MGALSFWADDVVPTELDIKLMEESKRPFEMWHPDDPLSWHMLRDLAWLSSLLRAD